MRTKRVSKNFIHPWARSEFCYETSPKLWTELKRFEHGARRWNKAKIATLKAKSSWFLPYILDILPKYSSRYITKVKYEEKCPQIGVQCPHYPPKVGQNGFSAHQFSDLEIFFQKYFLKIASEGLWFLDVSKHLESNGLCLIFTIFSTQFTIFLPFTPDLEFFNHFHLKNRNFENMIFRRFRRFWIEWN